MVVSGNAISVKGSYERFGSLNTDTFSVSRVDLTYSRRHQISNPLVDGVADDTYTGQCELVEDKVERAF